MPDDDTHPSVPVRFGRLSRWLLRMDVSIQILIALILGILCGLFFGELCGRLSIVGDVFIGLLRMTVLPYIAITLIASLGKLTLSNSRRLAIVGVSVLTGLWTICLITIWLLAASFPDIQSGSFFSTAMIQSTPKPDLMSYFVPSNIFQSLAGNHVPAIVVFSIFCGVALARTDRRGVLLEQLDVAAGALMGVSRFVTRLAPIGIFAIAASTAGTVSLAEISRLQAYLVAYIAGSLFLGFIVLPGLVVAVTPLTYRQVLFVVKEPMLTAFATGKLIVVLPMLIENTERLFKRDDLISGEVESPAVDALYGTAYPFPHIGKLLSLLFIPFAAWFLGVPFRSSDYPGFLGSGLFAFFGGPVVAIPFLLDQMHLPHDMFQLYLVSGVVGERFGDAVGVMHLAAFTMISVFAFNGRLRINLAKGIRYVLATAVIGGMFLGGVQFFLYGVVQESPPRAEIIERMQLLHEAVESKVILVPTPNPDPLLDGERLMDRIRRRGVLRVGYNEDKVPFAFFNARGTLVGYDVEMAHALAKDIAVKLEFVRFERSTLVEQLKADHFDVVMSGLVGTLERAQAMQHTESYLDVNLALAVPDFRVHEFKTLKAIREHGDLTIGLVDLSRGFVERLKAALPDVTIVEIGNNLEFFQGQHPELDALLISAESGSAFTLMHPEYEVVIPRDVNVQLPLFYVIGNNDAKMRDFLEHWIELRRKDGTAQEFYDHWVLGKTAEASTPRWSVIRDYLHWIE
ncbi:cation:dicarboxylate symporter family transporter [Stieleria varia]|uniref:cation:dicarboxylate symporter family transporter n=1 Tax=Stieleria varia TaxID=2528005 RepID=UPI0011B74291|nr:cation:dicarboxylase symporter family transporter [Stieleria varia]